MGEMPSLNMLVQRLKVAILPLDLPCSGPVTHSGEILTTVKSHGKTSPQLAEGRDLWIRETGTGQQVAQFHERYMMMMMRLAKQSSAFNLVSRKNSPTLHVSAALGDQIRMYVETSSRRIHLKFSDGNCNVPQNVGTYSNELC